jgi:hypothetical protein
MSTVEQEEAEATPRCHNHPQRNGHVKASDRHLLLQILHELLRPSSALRDDGCGSHRNKFHEHEDEEEKYEVIAATLHESACNELPVRVFRRRKAADAAAAAAAAADSVHPTTCATTAVLFAGAVRDMSTMESDYLDEACLQSKVDLIPVRLGPVAEFTSKILSIVAFHHGQDRLIPGLRQLLLSQQMSRRRLTCVNDRCETRIRGRLSQQAEDLRDGSAISTGINARKVSTLERIQRPSSLSLACVLLVPFDSSEVTADLGARRRLWPLIRCAVVSLWRSRVVASRTAHATASNSSRTVASVMSASTNNATASTAYNNRLLLVFADRFMVALDESSIVEMAERHQAAPCEHQVVQLIQRQIIQQAAQRQRTRNPGGASLLPEQHRSPQQLQEPDLAFNDWVEQFTKECMSQSSTRSSSSSHSDVSNRIVVLDLHPEEGLDLGYEFYSNWNWHDDWNIHESLPENSSRNHCQLPIDDSNERNSSLLVIVLLSLPDLGEHATTRIAATSGGEATRVSSEAGSDYPQSSRRDGYLRALSQQHRADVIRACMFRCPCLDRCAASIALLQHFGYQDPCFFLALNRTNVLHGSHYEAQAGSADDRTTKSEPPRKKLKKVIKNPRK